MAMSEAEIRAFVKSMTPGDLFGWLLDQPGSREFVCRQAERCVLAEFISSRVGTRCGYACGCWWRSAWANTRVTPRWTRVFELNFDKGHMGTTVSSIINWMLTTYKLERPQRNAEMRGVARSGT